jgi:CDP-diacylglycerol--glycerol-3-phosphate 3-phosphatidyltransferase
MTRRDVGLYMSKYALRRWLDRIPGISRLSPNAVSISSLIPSALAAVSLWQAWWALVVVGIAGRMVLTVLDGHIAEAYDRRTRIGPYLNRLPQEAGDAMLFFALFALADPLWVGLVLASAWIVNVMAILPLLAGGTPQWVGPGGQPDRIAVVMVAAAVAIAVPLQWDWICALLVALMALTVCIRLYRSVRQIGFAKVEAL